MADGEHTPSGRVRFWQCVGGALATLAILAGLMNLEQRARTMQRESQERRNQRVRHLLSRATRAARNGQYALALSTLRVLGRCELTPDEKTSWLSATADIYRRKGVRERGRRQKVNFASAEEFYQRALACKATPSVRARVRIRFLELLLKEQRWADADALFRQLDKNEVPESQRVGTSVDLGDYSHSEHRNDLRHLRLLVAQAPNDEIWATAARARTNLLLDFVAATDAKPAKEEEARQAFAASLEAEALCNEIVGRLHVMHPFTMEARANLVHIFALRGAEKDAYRVAAQNMEGQLTPERKADCLLHLAKLHERKGELGKAVTVLETGLVKFPESRAIDPILLALYDLNLRHDRWNRAMAAAERLAEVAQNVDVAAALFDRLLEDECPVWQRLASPRSGKFYIERVEKLLAAARNSAVGHDDRIAGRVACLVGKAQFYVGRYRKAEDHFASCLTPEAGLATELAEETAMLDFLAARKLERSPMAVAFRARRYLEDFPGGKHTELALMTLLDEYYGLGLYRAAAETARSAFVKELKDMGTAGDFSATDEWVRTVARIGQCYEKLGLFDKANSIFRTHADVMISGISDPELFLAWAHCASEVDQRQEAIRRLDVVLATLRDPLAALEVHVARSVLALESRNSDAEEDAYGVIETIIQTPDLTEEKRGAMLRKLYEALLTRAFEDDPSKVAPLLRDSASVVGSGDWLPYWIARASAPEYAAALVGVAPDAKAMILASMATDPRSDSSVKALSLKQLAIAENVAALQQSVAELEAQELK